MGKAEASAYLQVNSGTIGLSNWLKRGNINTFSVTNRYRNFLSYFLLLSRMWITADACYGAKFVELYKIFAAIAEIDMYLKAHNKQEGCLQNTN